MNRDEILNRNLKFLEHVKALYPDVVIPSSLGVNSTMEDLRNTYSCRVYSLIFSPDEVLQAPLYINASSIWLRSAALFCLKNPL